MRVLMRSMKGTIMAHLLIPTYDLDETLATIEHTRALYDVAPIAVGDAYSEGDNLVVRVDSNDDTIALLADVFDIDIDDDDPFVTDDVDEALTDGRAHYTSPRASTAYSC